MTTTAEIEAAVRLATKLSPEDARLVTEALTRAESVGRAEGVESVQRAVLAARIVCPVHGIPDCGPLLNGCSVPRYIAEWRGEFLADLATTLGGVQ